MSRARACPGPANQQRSRLLTIFTRFDFRFDFQDIDMY
jgi:hypothetical protein